MLGKLAPYLTIPAFSLSNPNPAKTIVSPVPASIVMVLFTALYVTLRSTSFPASYATNFSICGT